MGRFQVSRRALALIGVVLAVGAAAIVLARSAEPAYPTGDVAVIESYTREAASGRLLEGPYSRFGWHHPGPLLFYLLAPFLMLGGGTTAALNAGGCVLSLAAACVTVWFVTRSAGSVPSTASLTAMAYLLWRLPELSDSVWNPHAVVIPAIAFIAVAAVVAAGDLAGLPIVAFLASFLMQTDVALVAFAVTVSIAMVIPAAKMTRGRGRYVAAAAGVALIAWMAPIVEQILDAPGNMTLLWRFFVSGHGEGQSWARALAAWSGAMTAPFRLEFGLAYGADLDPALSMRELTAAGMLLLATAAAAGWARHIRARAVAWMGLLSLTASFTALWSATRIEGSINDHTVFWFAAIAVSCAATCLAAATLWIQRHVTLPSAAVRRAGPVAQALLLAFMAWTGFAQVDRARRGSFPVTITVASVPNFGGSIRQYLAGHHVSRPLVRFDQDRWGLIAGIVLELQRHHVDVAIEDSWASMYPRSFRATGVEDAELAFAAADTRLDLLARPGNVTVDSSRQLHVEAIRIVPRINFNDSEPTRRR